MKEDQSKTSYSVFFIVFVLASLLFLQFVHLDFSLAIPEYNRKIVLIYNEPVISNEPVKKTELVLTERLDTLSFKDKLEISVVDTNVVDQSIERVETYNVDSLYYSNLMDEYRQNRKTRKQKPVIRYYTKPNDGETIYGLRQFGYYIHKRESPTSLDLYSSNAISFGDSVNIEDIELIAYYLISNGLNLQEISRSRYSWKYNAIEIGTDTTILDLSNIQIEELRNALDGL